MPGTAFSTGNWSTSEEKVATNPSANLEDFTLLFDLSLLGSSWQSAVQSDAGDIRVTKGDDTELPFDMIDWDYNAGSPTGYLRIKWSGTLASSGTQSIKLWAGYTGGGSAVAYGADETFGSDNAYDANWACYFPFDGEDPSGTAPQASDRTSNGETATSNGTMLTEDLVAGQVGEAWDFDGTDDFARITQLGIGTTANFTACCWIKADTLDGFDGIIFNRSSTTGLAVSGASGNPLGYTWQNTIDEYSAASGLSIPTDGTWVFAALAVSPTEAVLSLGNGGSINTFTNTKTHDATNLNVVFDVGQDSFGGRFFDGAIDDVQIHSATRSAEWLEEEYHQTNDQETFWGDATPGTVSQASVATDGETYEVDIYGMDPAQITGIEAGKSVTATDGTVTINLSFVSAAQSGPYARLTMTGDSLVLSSETFTLSADAGAFNDGSVTSLVASGVAIANNSTQSADSDIDVTAAALVDANTLRVTLTAPNVAWGTITLDDTELNVWAESGYGHPTISSSSSGGDGTQSATVDLDLSRNIHTDELLELESTDTWLTCNRGNAARVHWSHAIAAIFDGSNGSAPTTTTVVSFGRTAITLSSAASVDFHADGGPAIDVQTTNTITAEYPARGTAGGGEAIHGAALNPSYQSNPYDEREANLLTYDSGDLPALPVTVSAGDSYIKLHSTTDAESTSLDGATSSQKTFAKFWGVYHFVSSSPVANQFTPPTVGSSRDALTADLDAIVATLPSKALTGLGGTPPDLHLTLTRTTQSCVGRWSFLNDPQRPLIPAHFTAVAGYGLDQSVALSNALIHLMGDEATDAQKRHLLKWLIHNAIQLYWTIKDRGTHIPENGGLEEGWTAAVVAMLNWTGKTAELANLYDTLGMNELGQTFLWDQAHIDRHNNLHTAGDADGFPLPDDTYSFHRRLHTISTAQALTTVEDNGSGKCRFTLNGHGLSVNRVLWIYGATAASLNTSHTITAVDTNTFDTDVDFATSATAGTFGGIDSANDVIEIDPLHQQYAENVFNDIGLRLVNQAETVESQITAHARYQFFFTVADSTGFNESDNVKLDGYPGALPSIGTPDWGVVHHTDPTRTWFVGAEGYRPLNKWSMQIMLLRFLGWDGTAFGGEAWYGEADQVNGNVDYLGAHVSSPTRHESAYAGLFWDAFDADAQAAAEGGTSQQQRTLMHIG